jgi:hypothetical protein
MNDLNNLNGLKALKRQARLNIGKDKMQIGVAVFYVLIVTAQALTQPAVTALVWGLIYTVLYAGATWFSYRSELRSLRWADERRQIDEKLAAERHAHDLEMERLAQEDDLIDADHERRMALIPVLGYNPGPSDEVREIQARRDRETAERQAERRAERQARIAAHEARSL